MLPSGIPRLTNTRSHLRSLNKGRVSESKLRQAIDSNARALGVVGEKMQHLEGQNSTKPEGYKYAEQHVTQPRTTRNVSEVLKQNPGHEETHVSTAEGSDISTTRGSKGGVALHQREERIIGVADLLSQN